MEVLHKDFAVTMEERKRSSVIGPSGTFLFARIMTRLDGVENTFEFSRFPNEKEWYCDAHLRRGFPVFVHGPGSRCCIKQNAQGEMKEALEKATTLYAARLQEEANAAAQ